MSKFWIDNPGGSGFYSCECVRAVWPLFVAEAKKRGLIKQCIDVYQGSYNKTVRASAKTHFGGGCLDFGPATQALDDLAEEFGFSSFLRTPADGFSYHTHAVLRGCPHLHWQAAAQVTSWLNRRNGLANNRADRDKTRPSVIRNWREVVTWVGNGATEKAKKVVLAKAKPFSFDQLDKAVKSGKKGSSHVRVVQNQLNRSGWSKKILGRNLVEDGFWGAETTKVYAGYQYAKGYRGKAADGKPGRTTATLLLSWRYNPYRVI